MKKKLKIILCIFLALYLVGSVIATHVIFALEFVRVDAPEYSGFLQYGDVDCPRREISFLSGENRLTGWVYGEENNAGLVVMAHGLGSTAESYLAQTVWFVEQGYRVLTYDATGSGASEGTDTVGLSQSVLDLDAALTYAESDETLRGLPVLLFGHSWGGYAVAAVLEYDHDVTACVSVSGYDTPMDLMCETAYNYCGPIAYAGYPFLLAHQWVLFGSAANRSAADSISATDIPVLIVHGSEDGTIRADGAGLIAHREKITNPNVEFLLLEGEDHLSLLRPHTTQYTEYVNRINADYQALYDWYDGAIPDEIKAQYYSQVDKSITGGVYEPLMERINDFYTESLTMSRRQSAPNTN